MIDAFVSIVRNVAKVSNTTWPGKRWRFVSQRAVDTLEVVYIDHEADPFWHKGSLAVVLCNGTAGALMQFEKTCGRHIPLAEAGEVFERYHVRARNLRPLEDGTLVATDSTGRYVGSWPGEDRFPKHMLDAGEIDEV